MNKTLDDYLKFATFSESLPKESLQGDYEHEILIRNPSVRGYFKVDDEGNWCVMRSGMVVYAPKPDDQWAYYEDWLAVSHPSKESPGYLSYINANRRPRKLHPFELAGGILYGSR